MPEHTAKIPMKVLQRADQILGGAVCLLLWPLHLLRRRAPWSSRGLSPGQEPGHILLIKFWGIGSLQLLTPAARHLRQEHPGARLTLLTLAENEAFASGLGVFDDVIQFDVRRGGWASLFARIIKLIARLRRLAPDAVYDFEFFTRFSAVVSVATGARVLHGFHSPSVWRGGFHTRTVPFNRYWHVARNFRALVGGENGVDVSCDDVVPYRVPLALGERLRAFLDRRGHDAARPLVVLNPNAGHLSLERRWPRERFAALARRLIEEQSATVALIGSAAEADYTHEVVQLAAAAPAERLLDLSGGLDIGELCALLQYADLVVSNDSGPMHLAAALATPTIGLFGPETPVMYRPLGGHVLALWRPPVCSPCINVHDNKVATCIHGSPECLMNLSVEEVFGQAHAALQHGVLQPFATRTAFAQPVTPVAPWVERQA